MSDKETKTRLKPDLLGGFRDYLPEVMIPRQKIIAKIRETFESFGFVPLDTPGLERSSVLGTDRDEFKMEVYRFQSGDQDVTLRFDLTVPLSRVVAAYPDILKPFKRYQYGMVWRHEKPQAGRFREFAQFDADIVGSNSILSDTEIIQLMYETLRNLGLKNYVIRFNNRKILNGLPAVAGFAPERSADVFRILDKLDKIGLDEVVKELQRQPDNQYDESALALDDASVEKIKEFLALSEGNIDSLSLINGLKSFFAGVAVAEEGVSECEQIIANLQLLGIPQANWKFDLSIARGLGYYTGPVFETTLTDLPQIGSVFSGGRFDDLVMRYTGEKVPAVGASVGVDRLIAAMDQLGILPREKATAKVMIANIDATLQNDILVIASKLRAAGIKTEIYLGYELTLKGQLIYTLNRGVPYLIIYGANEAKDNKVTLKALETKKQELLTVDEVIERLTEK